MERWPRHPTVYEINTWVWLNELSRQEDRRVTLGSVPACRLQELADVGFDGVWLMGVWQRSHEARKVAQETTDYRPTYCSALPDYTLDDIVASPYAIYRYHVDPALGGEQELAILRKHLRSVGLRLILDFAPSHLARDHSWLLRHPDYLVQGSPSDLEQRPGDYFTKDIGGQRKIFAHGRDPYFPAWPDTVAVDYRRPEARRAMADILLAIAERCDGVRCDMAMLVNQDVFLHTWGGAFGPPEGEFWPTVIPEVKKKYPEFLMLAEVYWGLEQEFKLQRMGFHYVYDKRLYEQLRNRDVTLTRAHLQEGDSAYQGRLARFIENHDEERARTTFGLQGSQTAAALAFTLPGLRLFYEGQLEGRRIKLPVQLARRQLERAEPELKGFYERLLTALRHPIFHDGEWKMLEPQTTWSQNSSYDRFVAYRWSLGNVFRLVAVNLSFQRAQCRLRLDLPMLAGSTWLLQDLLSDACYQRVGDELLAPGLYLDVPGGGYHLFELRRG